MGPGSDARGQVAAAHLSHPLGETLFHDGRPAFHLVRPKVCPHRSLQACQHWLGSAGLTAPNTQNHFTSDDQATPDDQNSLLKELHERAPRKITLSSSVGSASTRPGYESHSAQPRGIWIFRSALLKELHESPFITTARSSAPDERIGMQAHGYDHLIISPGNYRNRKPYRWGCNVRLRSPSQY